MFACLLRYPCLVPVMPKRTSRVSILQRRVRRVLTCWHDLLFGFFSFCIIASTEDWIREMGGKTFILWAGLGRCQRTCNSSKTCSLFPTILYRDIFLRGLCKTACWPRWSEMKYYIPYGQQMRRRMERTEKRREWKQVNLTTDQTGERVKKMTNGWLRKNMSKPDWRPPPSSA